MQDVLRKSKDVVITGGMALWYDKNSRGPRRAELAGYAREIAADAAAGAAVLEIAPGPGYTAIELAKMGDFAVCGMDLSADFIAICKANAEREGAQADFVQGNVSAMPFDDGRFDYIFCSAAFKNFHAPERALAEMYRVLKPGGKGLIIDMNKNATAAERKAEVDKMGLKGLERLFMRFCFAFFLRSGAYTKTCFEKMLAASPFGGGIVEEKGLSLYVRLKKAG